MAQLIETDTKRSHVVGPHTVIGRDEACQVQVDDPMVSASHAEIVQTPDGTFQIRDLGSRRGTYVGSKKVTLAALRDGDELMIGPKRLRFEHKPAVSASDSEELTRLRAVVELGRAIGVEHDLERLLGRVLDTCFQLLRADRGAMVIYHPHSKAPFLTVTRNRHGDESFAVSTSVLGQVMVTHQPYMRTEVEADVVLQRSASLSASGVRSVMAVPLRYEADETEWLGVILLASLAVVHADSLTRINALKQSVSLVVNTAAAVVFVVAWVGQFIGHQIEGKRPSFLTDITYLLIGPAWLAQKALRKFGIAI